MSFRALLVVCVTRSDLLCAAVPPTRKRKPLVVASARESRVQKPIIGLDDAHHELYAELWRNLQRLNNARRMTATGSGSPSSQVQELGVKIAEEMEKLGDKY